MSLISTIYLIGLLNTIRGACAFTFLVISMIYVILFVFYIIDDLGIYADTIERCGKAIKISKYAFIASLLGIILLPNPRATAAITAIYVSEQLPGYPDNGNVHSKVIQLINNQLANALSESN